MNINNFICKVFAVNWNKNQYAIKILVSFKVATSHFYFVIYG